MILTTSFSDPQVLASISYFFLFLETFPITAGNVSGAYGSLLRSGCAATLSAPHCCTLLSSTAIAPHFVTAYVVGLITAQFRLESHTSSCLLLDPVVMASAASPHHTRLGPTPIKTPPFLLSLSSIKHSLLTCIPHSTHSFCRETS